MSPEVAGYTSKIALVWGMLKYGGSVGLCSLISASSTTKVSFRNIFFFVNYNSVNWGVYVLYIHTCCFCKQAHRKLIQVKICNTFVIIMPFSNNKENFCKREMVSQDLSTIIFTSSNFLVWMILQILLILLLICKILLLKGFQDQIGISSG